MKQHDDQANKKMPQEDGSDLPTPAETRRRLTKVFFREVLKTSFYPLAAAALIAVGSIAWFVSNTRVQSGMISLSAEMETVRLATKGFRQEAEKNLLDLAEGKTATNDGQTYYYTEDGTIALRLSEPDMTVSPGASGPIQFYIIPTRDGPAQVTLYLDLAGYTAIKDHGTTAGVKPVTDDPALDALLSGHILLFGNYESGHYSGWLFNGTNSITVTLPEGTKEGVPFPVTLYWVWPLRYENMEQDLYTEGSEEYNRVFAPFIEDQAKTMMGPVGTSYQYSRIFLTNKAPLTDTESRSNAYNLADEYIGTNADFLYLTIQTERTSSSMGSIT